jgi:hypothetical protein
MSCGGEPCWAYVVFILRDLLLSWQLGKRVRSLRVGEGSCKWSVEGKGGQGEGGKIMSRGKARTVRAMTEA